MRPPYLTGDRIYLRPMLLGDREHGAAWFDSPFPVNFARAEAFLKEEHTEGWEPAPRLHLAIVRLAGDEVIGGATVDGPGGRTSELLVRVAPWLADGDEVRAEVLRLAVPWLRDEVEMMTVTAPIAADEATVIAAAEELGMVLGARLREHVARPGDRVDLLLYQALNPRWQVRDA